MDTIYFFRVYLHVRWIIWSLRSAKCHVCSGKVFCYSFCRFSISEEFEDGVKRSLRLIRSFVSLSLSLSLCDIILIIVLTSISIFFLSLLSLVLCFLPCCMAMTLTGNTLNSFSLLGTHKLYRQTRHTYHGKERKKRREHKIALQYLRTPTLC